MSLIQCPECKKEISDKSKVCIHCGYPMFKESTTQQVEVTSVNISSSKNIKKIVLTLAFILISAVSIFFANQKYNEFELERLIVKSFIEIDAVIDTSDLTTALTYETWSSAIKTNKDFNNALRDLYKRKDMEVLVGMIHDSKKSSDVIYEKILKFENINSSQYKIYLDLYDKFNKIVRFSTSPEGSLQSYGQEKRNIFEDYRSIRDRLKPMLHFNIMEKSYFGWLKMKYNQF